MTKEGSALAGAARIAALACAVGLAGAVGARADDGPAHQAAQDGAIALGTTGGNINDRTKLFCCGGTLGALVTNEFAQDYILSNNHVLARTNLAAPGETILHPSLIDQTPACSQDAADTVGTLADFREIYFDGSPNTVDAAIAAVDPGVTVSPEILDIGAIGTLPYDVTLADLNNKTVKKSGRTTGLTVGTLAAIDVTLEVTYTKECNKGRQKAVFVRQIRVADTHGDFSAGGDSGSLVVENVADFPRPVGLLFAGASSGTFINPIQEVFDCLDVDMGGGLDSEPVNCSHPVAGGGGDDGGGGKGGPPPGRGNNRGLPAGLEIAAQVKAAHDAGLLAIPGVVGTGLSVDAEGGPVIEVYERAAVRAPGVDIPASIEGIPVRRLVTGPIIAE